MITQAINFFNSINPDIKKTLLIIVIMLMIYKVLIYIIKRKNLTTENFYTKQKSLRTTLFIVFLIIEFFIWSGELKTVFLSAAAITAAMIVAFKEIILCVAGYIITKANNIFEVGDYIEYDNIRGQVKEKNLLYTKLVVGQSLKAQELNIPNVVFITNKVSNLSRFGVYQKYDLLLHVPNIKDISIYKKELEIFLNNYVELNKEKYNEYFIKEKEKDIFFEIPEKYYIVQYNLTDGRNIRIKVSILSHPLDYRTLEEEIINNFIHTMEKNIVNDDNKIHED